MGRNKSSIKYGYLFLGVWLLYVGWPKESVYNERSLKKLTIELAADVHNVKSRSNPIDYRLFAKEYENDFVIVDGSITKGRHQQVSNLKKGQLVDFYISLDAYNKLGLDEEDILLRGLSVKGQSLMSQEEFLSNQEGYEQRKMILFLVGGIISILNGLFSIPNKYNYGIVALTIVALMMM